MLCYAILYYTIGNSNITVPGGNRGERGTETELLPEKKPPWPRTCRREPTSCPGNGGVLEQDVLLDCIIVYCIIS